MIYLSITQAWVTANPQLPLNAFTLSIGEPGYLYQSPSNSIVPSDRTSPAVKGGPSQVLLRMNESFSLGNQEFETIIYSAKNGGTTNFLNRLLYLVNNSIVQVQQDNGAPLSADDIYNYTAP